MVRVGDGDTDRICVSQVQCITGIVTIQKCDTYIVSNRKCFRVTIWAIASCLFPLFSRAEREKPFRWVKRRSNPSRSESPVARAQRRANPSSESPCRLREEVSLEHSRSLLTIFLFFPQKSLLSSNRDGFSFKLWFVRGERRKRWLLIRKSEVFV
jgi:hypothetical protein